MKVKPSRGSSSSLGATKTSIQAGERPNFAESIKSAQRNLLDEELKSLLDKAREIGNRFLKSPDESSLDDYKNAIQVFLQRASKELFSLKQEMGFASKGQQKVYQLVVVVNQELDSLTRETLQKDKALQLLAGLDDIRGLIVDFFK